MEAVHLIIVVPLALWLGARIGRKVPWSTGRALLALVFVVPLALAVGVPAEQVMVDAICLGTGLLWVRRSRSGERSAPFEANAVDVASFDVGQRNGRPAMSPAVNASIREQRRGEMARLRAQRKGKKSPIF
jgi:hypothetical protein